MATSIFRLNFPGAAKLQEAADTAAYIIGLDLHKKTVAICVIDPKHPDAPLFQRKQLANSNLLTTLQRFPGKKLVACEAAYGWYPLRDALQGMTDVTLVLLDAGRTSSWVKTSGIKNDKIDAQVLCYACLHGGIGRLAIHPSGPREHACVKLVQYRDSLVRQRTKVKHQLSAFERDYGPNPFTGEIPEKSPLLLFQEGSLREELAALDERIATVEEQMKKESKADAIVTRLRTIPGIGPITAFALRYRIENIDRFADASRLSSYFGFGVREHQSGGTIEKGKITKTGNALIRKLLIQGAQAVCFSRPDLVSLYFPVFGDETRKHSRRHTNKLVAALARKNLTFAFHVWKKQVPFDIEWYRERRQKAALASSGARDRSSASGH